MVIHRVQGSGFPTIRGPIIELKYFGVYIGVPLFGETTILTEAHLLFWATTILTEAHLQF